MSEYYLINIVPLACPWLNPKIVYCLPYRNPFTGHIRLKSCDEIWKEIEPMSLGVLMLVITRPKLFDTDRDHFELYLKFTR
jgi:hypothetical protein